MYKRQPATFSLVLQEWDGLTAKKSLYISNINFDTAFIQQISKNTIQNSGVIANYYTLMDDGDVLCDIYDVYSPDSSENYLQLSSYNMNQKLVKGSFQATFLIKDKNNKCLANAPDTIRFRNGEFYTKFSP